MIGSIILCSKQKEKKSYFLINHASITDQQLLASRTGLREHRESTLSLLVRSYLCLLMRSNKYVVIQYTKEIEKEERNKIILHFFIVFYYFMKDFFHQKIVAANIYADMVFLSEK